MKIVSIKQDQTGHKLIAAYTVIDNKGYKPSLGHCTFFTYKDGILKEFHGTNVTSYNIGSYKRALYNILNDTHFNFSKKYIQLT